MVAVMASRQLPKSWNDQTVMIGLKSEAGQAQLITTAVDATHGMHVSADVEQNAVVLGRPFWFMAEPQPSKTLGSLLGQAFNHAASVVIATDPIDLCIDQVRQRPQNIAQVLGQAKP